MKRLRYGCFVPVVFLWLLVVLVVTPPGELWDWEFVRDNRFKNNALTLFLIGVAIIYGLVVACEHLFRWFRKQTSKNEQEIKDT